MSTHEVPVIRVEKVLSHSNADELEIIPAWGYQCVVRKGEFKPGDLAAYIEPDYTVPVDVPEFSFLESKAKNGRYRLRAVRLRGELSYGLLIPAREVWIEGQNVMEELGVERYEPPISISGAEDASPPKLYAPIYGLENLRKFPDILQPGEQIIVTEKIHGANFRAVWHDGLHVGSHRRWKKDGNNFWWETARRYGLEEKLRTTPGTVFYGELYGVVRGFPYDASKSEPGLAFYDALVGDRWLSNEDLNHNLRDLGLPPVPVIDIIEWNPKISLSSLADGMSLLNFDHMAEGAVLRTDRIDPSFGRVILKLVSDRYLERGR